MRILVWTKFQIDLSSFCHSREYAFSVFCICCLIPSPYLSPNAMDCPRIVNQSKVTLPQDTLHHSALLQQQRSSHQCWCAFFFICFVFRILIIFYNLFLSHSTLPLPPFIWISFVYSIKFVYFHFLLPKSLICVSHIFLNGWLFIGAQTICQNLQS